MLITFIATCAPDSNGISCPLTWPKFYKESISSRDWDAASEQGRIKLELSGGSGRRNDAGWYLEKISNIVIFSFFPCPIRRLPKVC